MAKKKKKHQYKLEAVFSPIFDKDITKHIVTSSIWSNSLHYEDVTDEDIKKGGYVYTIYFDGTLPVSVTSVTKVEDYG